MNVVVFDGNKQILYVKWSYWVTSSSVTAVLTCSITWLAYSPTGKESSWTTTSQLPSVTKKALKFELKVFITADNRIPALTSHGQTLCCVLIVSAHLSVTFLSEKGASLWDPVYFCVSHRLWYYWDRTCSGVSRDDLNSKLIVSSIPKIASIM